MNIKKLLPFYEYFVNNLWVSCKNLLTFLLFIDIIMDMIYVIGTEKNNIEERVTKCFFTKTNI